MAATESRVRPEPATAPRVLTVLLALAVVFAAVWGFVASARLGPRDWDTTTHPGLTTATDDAVRSVVTFFPVLVAVLTTLTIIAWVNERRRLRRRSRLLRRLYAALGDAAGVVIDIDLLEAGSPYSRTGSRDVFDALEQEANALLAEGDELAARILSKAWRERNGRDEYLDSQVVSIADRAAFLARRAASAATPLPQGSTETPDTPARLDPFGAQWQGTAAAIEDEWQRTRSLLAIGEKDPSTGWRTSRPDAASVVMAARTVWNRAKVSPDVVDDPYATSASEQTLRAREAAAVQSLGAMSDLLVGRLQEMQGRGAVSGALERARAISAEHAAALPAPWQLVGPGAVTPSAFLEAADAALARDRESSRPGTVGSGWERTWENVAGKGGALQAALKAGGVRGVIGMFAFLGVGVVLLGTWSAGLIAGWLPWGLTAGFLPFLGLAAALLLSAVPLLITGLVFSLTDSGVFAQRSRSRQNRAALHRASQSLAAIVARWDDTLLTLTGAVSDGPGSLAFTRRRQGLESALSAALRTERALDAVPHNEQAEPVFRAEVDGLEAQVKRLGARQAETLALGRR